MTVNQIIAQPAHIFPIRLAQIVLAILILILNVVSIALLGGYGAFGYGIFTPFATCVIVAYWYIANYRRPTAYNRWVILILDCFAVLWWLSLWGVLASWAAALGVVDSVDNAYGYSNLNNIKLVYALTAVAAVLGAGVFVLFVVTLITFALRLHAARRSERQGMHGVPFENPNYQQMNGGAPQGQYPAGQKGGFEVSAA